ncbi:c-type cytochrome [Flavobacterium haoranii]|uniref:Dihaem cytochrome c n=1 Tax=Flavobacterium haoranii TaxID=683124 RepID=A0A1M6M421_9FLAO|nr:cytochrome c [Flavobacterium haoranii]SHJ78161.1 hypothetical protein SAMN05444337_2618 [Flavobacterium haoranii]
MRTKLLSIIVDLTLLASCSSSKNAVAKTETKTKPIAVLEVVELTPELAQGKSIYEGKCGRCHKLPAVEDFTVEEWQPIMLRMQKKAKISDEERELVYNYVTMK